MNFETFYEFVVLADTGNYEEAAFKLFTTQSTLSKHIMGLEDQLGGTPLFKRGRNGSELTGYGKKFYIYAQQIVNLYDDFVKETSGTNKSSHTLHIGYAAGMDSYGFFEIIKAFCNEHPDYNVFMEDERIARKLHNGEVDVGLLFEDQSNTDLASELIRHDRLVPIVPADHPLAGAGKINIVQLKEYPFVMFPSKLFLHDKCMEYCARHGFYPRIAHTIAASDLSTLIGFVAQGFGVSVIPENEARFWQNDDFVILEPTDNFLLNICIQYKQTHMLTEAENEFIRYMKDHTEDPYRTE